MARKPKTLKPVRPSAAVGAFYERELDKLIDEMERSLSYWLEARYRRAEPEITQDANPVVALQKMMTQLTAKWRLKFNMLSRSLAPAFAEKAMGNVDSTFRSELKKKAGFTIEFRPTEGVQNAMRACVNDNVALIKSIGEEHLSEVNQMVWRAVAHGGIWGN